MKVVSNNFSIYLNNSYNFKYINNKLKNDFYTIYNIIRTGTQIPIDFKKHIDNYPKYPNNFVLIKNTSGFNVKTIYNITNDATDVLSELINSNVLGLKLNLDNIPSMINELIQDVSLQNTYFSSIGDLYDKTQKFFNYYQVEEYTNYCYDIMGTPIDESLNDVEFIQQITTLLFINFILYRSTNIVPQISDYLVSGSAFSYDKILTNFTKFITNKTNTISDELTNIILKYVYSIIDPSDTLHNLVNTTITSQIGEISNIFNEYSQYKMSDVTILLSKYISDYILHIINIKVLPQLFSNTSVTPYSKETSFTIVEDDLLNEKFGLINKYSIKDHLFLSYIYKFWPIKFLNVLSIILKNYVETKIFTEDDINPNFYDLKQYLTMNMKYCLNIEELSEYLPTLITPDKISTWLTDSGGILFPLNLYFLSFFDEFLGSSVFTNFMTNLLESVFEVLNKNGYVDYDYNWNQKHEILKIYFISFIRYNLVNGTLFDDLKSNGDELMTQFFSQTHDLITDEIPSGVIDGENIYYSVQYQFAPDSLIIKIINSDTLEETILNPSEYRSVVSSHSIILNNPVAIGSIIKITYSPSYGLILNFNETTMQYRFTSFSESTTTFNLLRKFVENIYLSTITKQVYFDTLARFLL